MAHRTPEPAPASFLARYVAWSLDAACLLAPVALFSASPVRSALAQAQAAWRDIAAETARLLGEALSGAPSALRLAHALLADPALLAAIARLQVAIAGALLTPLLLYALFACLWSVGFDSSPWQATPGKRALGLRVVDAAGRRLRTGRALARFLAAGLSWLTGNIGHAMAMMPSRLALHDRVSDTRVVGGRAALPAWAGLWLALQALALCVGVAWVVADMQAALDAALLPLIG